MKLGGILSLCFFIYLGSCDFDFFLLAEQWGPSFCRTNNCNGAASAKWSIHGLWPTTDTTPYPGYCEDVTYDKSLLSSIESQLSKEWPTLKSGGTNHEFWEYQWDKHGSCGLSNPRTDDQFSFFNETLGLHYSTPIQQVLSNAGIQPSDTQTYSLTAIKNAFKSAWGGVPQVHCTSADGKTLIFEVRVCFNKNTLNRQACVENFDCPSQIYYPKTF